MSFRAFHLRKINSTARRITKKWFDRQLQTITSSAMQKDSILEVKFEHAISNVHYSEYPGSVLTRLESAYRIILFENQQAT